MKKIIIAGLIGLCFLCGSNVKTYAKEEYAEQCLVKLQAESEYVYYKVYDSFYGSNNYHTLDKELQQHLYDLCVEYEIEEHFQLLLCQLFYESLYRADVISPTNDYGIAQINICNHEWLKKELGITDFLDAKQNILCNVYMMSENLKKYDVETALYRYNTGKIDGTNTYSENIMYLLENGIVETDFS